MHVGNLYFLTAFVSRMAAKYLFQKDPDSWHLVCFLHATSGVVTKNNYEPEERHR